MMSLRDLPEGFMVRDYQINILDIALKRNTIVYLPTGTGKTLIAVMLLKKLGEPLQKPISRGGKISIMLANTTALVDQHSEYLKRLIPFEVGTYSGASCNKTWSKNTWKERLDKFQVFVMTPKALCNILNDSTLSFNNINLLIFDECHRAVHNHPMSQVMENYAKVGKVPRVLGLTATLLNKNCSPVDVVAEIKMLEKTLCSEIISAEPQHTKRYSTNPNEIIQKYSADKLSGVLLLAVEKLNDLFATISNFHMDSLNTSSEKVLKDLKRIIQDTIVQIEMFGLYGGKVAIKLRVNQLLDYKKPTIDVKISALTDAAVTLFRLLRQTFKIELKGYSKNNFSQHLSQRLLTLFNILKQHKVQEKQKFCAIIFAKRRLTVKVLYHILMKLRLIDKEYIDISPNFVLGSNSCTKSALLGLYKAKVYKRIIDQFCKQQINLLVASNVLEEGIDIPTCTLIINFDEPNDYRGYVQSKGRARSKSSNYYVMISENYHTAFMKSYENYKQMQDILQQVKQRYVDMLYSKPFFVNRFFFFESLDMKSRRFKGLLRPGAPTTNVILNALSIAYI